MTTKEPSNSYIYPLTAGQRGSKLYITKTDPRWTDPKKKAVLIAKYGASNIVLVPEYALSQVQGGKTLSSFFLETSSPTSNLQDGTVTLAPVSNVGLNPPTNLNIVGQPQTVSASNGTSQFVVTISFDDVPGATDYDVQFVSTGLGTLPQAVTGLTATGSGGTITATWNSIANASNYTLYAEAVGSTTPVFSSAPIVGTTGTISGLTSGSYQVVVTPYNSYGVAGTTASTTVSI